VPTIGNLALLLAGSKRFSLNHENCRVYDNSVCGCPKAVFFGTGESAPSGVGDALKRRLKPDLGGLAWLMLEDNRQR
jgi:hypothetical protein